jgi:hypothetical protein
LELGECTFKPDVSGSKSSMNMIRKRPKVTLKLANKGKSIMRTEYTHLESEEGSGGGSKIYCTTVSRE